MSCRRDVLKILLGILCFSTKLIFADSPVLVAYAKDFSLRYVIGQYDPATKGWLPYTASFHFPPAYSPFTLFGITGKIGEVHTLMKVQGENPWTWDVPISAWRQEGVREGVGLLGVWPEPPRVGIEQSLEDRDTTQAVVEFLRKHDLNVPQPRITQRVRVNLNGEAEEEIVCANSDRLILNDSDAAAVYTLALLLIRRNGQVEARELRSQVAYKPRGRSVDEHERRHGAIGYYRMLAVSDIRRDGREQVSILNDVRTGPEIDLFDFDGKDVHRLLSLRPVYY